MNKYNDIVGYVKILTKPSLRIPTFSRGEAIPLIEAINQILFVKTGFQNWEITRQASTFGQYSSATSRTHNERINKTNLSRISSESLSGDSSVVIGDIVSSPTTSYESLAEDSYVWKRNTFHYLYQQNYLHFLRELWKVLHLGVQAMTVS